MRTDFLFTAIIVTIIGLRGILSLSGVVPFLPANYVVERFGFTAALAVFALLSVAGLIGIANNFPSARTVPKLKFIILRYIATGRGPDEIAHITGVSKTEVHRQTDELRREGYITGNNRVTEKGYDALRWQQSDIIYRTV